VNNLDLSSVELLKYNWVFIILFFCLRVLSIKFQKEELVAPVGYGHIRDVFDDRKITLVDFICFVFYIIVWFSLKDMW
jgi:hypothetical protein